MRLKAISALTVFTTAMIIAFADSHPVDRGVATPDTVGDTREPKTINGQLAT